MPGLPAGLHDRALAAAGSLLRPASRIPGGPILDWSAGVHEFLLPRISQPVERLSGEANKRRVAPPPPRIPGRCA